MVRFDAYSATTRAVKAEELVSLFDPITRGLSFSQGKGFHQFGERLSLKDACGEVGSIQWGGRQGDRVMLEVKGESTPAVVERLRSLCPHRVTRVDSCADFDAPRAFEGLFRAFRKAKQEHRVWGERRGDWDDHPEKGRTFYLGANTSPTRARLYEKGLQAEYAHLGRVNWARAEVQVRPAKEAKEAFANLSALEVWGSSRWSRDLAGTILKEHVDPHPAGSVYRKTDLDRRLDWICKQAGPTLLELLDACGSWECVGLSLGERVEELRSRCSPKKE